MTQQCYNKLYSSYQSCNINFYYQTAMSSQNCVSSTSLGANCKLQQTATQLNNLTQAVFTKQSQMTIQYPYQQKIYPLNIKQLIEQIKYKIKIAKTFIENQQIDNALVLLIQAENNLEQLSQTANIDKKLIICVLHNLACCYQKNWQLQICSNYLQALIYNLNCFLNDKSDIVSEEAINKEKFKSKHFNKKTIKSIIQIENMQRLGYYYLQYCAVNSQIKNHSGALIAARKSIQILKQMFKSISLFLKQLSKKNCNWIKDQYDAKFRLVHQISKINDNISINQYEMILETTKYYLRKWASKKTQDSHINSKWFQLQQKYKNFSIGTIAQINSLSYDDILNISQQKCQQLFNYQSLLEKILIFIIGYFTISTQLRLMSNLKQNIIQNHNPTETSQFKQSEVFHLFSIMLTSIFVPFQILYMKHILMSYKNHFHFDLNDYCQYSDNKVYQDFLFTISQIKKPSLLALSFQDSLRISQIGNQVILQQGATGTHIKFNRNQEQFQKLPFVKKQRKTKSKSKQKKNTKSKSKTKQKSQNKKSTLKTISALSAQSKPKNKKDQIKKINCKSKSKSQGKSSVQKQVQKISYLKSIHSQKNGLNFLINKKNKKKQENINRIKVDPYYNLIKSNSKNKKSTRIISQTNQYFLDKKRSKIKGKSKQLSPNDIYYHKFEKQTKKSKSKPKSTNIKPKC